MLKQIGQGFILRTRAIRLLFFARKQFLHKANRVFAREPSAATIF